MKTADAEDLMVLADMERQPSKVDAQAFETAIMQTIPFAELFSFKVECLEAGYARVRVGYESRQLRAGGTISGPVIMTLADTALYGMVLSLLGMELLAVTVNLNVQFLRKPRQADLIAEATLLKHGRRLIVGQVLLYSDGEAEPVAHVTGSYAVP
jgi:uncharacterized protein (TIGR00369 family)